MQLLSEDETKSSSLIVSISVGVVSVCRLLAIFTKNSFNMFTVARQRIGFDVPSSRFISVILLRFFALVSDFIAFQISFGFPLFCLYTLENNYA